MRSFLPCIVAVACLMPIDTMAFAPRTFALPKSSTTRTSLSAVLPEHVDALSSAVDQWHHLVAASSTMLADADVAAADPAEQAGWWKTYLNFYKSTLMFVHSSIDEPLRNVGIEHSWGISIAIFTAGIRSLLIPLSVQQTKASEYMKALKPYTNEIKEKFKNNKDAQNRAIAKLYEDANQNPLAGCLVSLVQLPVFLGLYRGVRLLAMDGQLKEPFLWIPSLQGPVSGPDYRGMEWLTQGWTSSVDGGLPVPQLGWETTLAFLVMPVVLVLGQSLTMKVLAPPVDDEGMSEEEKASMEKTQGILQFLPLLIGFFSLQVPAGLTIYWFTSNIFSLTQSLVVKSYYAANPPKIELPDYWDALENMEDMSPEDRRKAAEAGLSSGPKFSDLLEEAQFHYVVQRGPLRADSEAWKRVEAGSSSVPSELEEWVANKRITAEVASVQAGAAA